MPWSLDWGVLWRPPFGDQIGDAVLLTVEIALVAWVIATALGIIVGVAREAPVAVVRALATAHVELFRNIPVLVQLFFIYYVLPRVLPVGIRRVLFDYGWEVVAAVLTLSLYSSAKVAEHVRAGMNAVGRPMRQAALSTGLTWWQAFRWVEANVFGTTVYLVCAWIIAGLMGLVARLTRVPGVMRRL
jgi:glutamate/aspartate transport system permease protein